MIEISIVEKLVEDLRPHVTERPMIGAMLHHPFVVMPISEATVDLANRLYTQKATQAREAHGRGDWNRYVDLHERPYRFDALMDAMLNDFGEEDPKQFWRLVGRVWTNSENIWQNLDGWLSVWSYEAPFRDHAMEEDDRAALASLPDAIQVWRGVSHPDAAEGMSWSTDKAKAEWFARRFAAMEGRGALLASGTVRKADVLAYFSDRSESEIVVDPSDITDKTVVALA